jgi:hypothetical protein
MKLSVACRVAIQALTLLGISRLVKAQTCADDANFVCGYTRDADGYVVEGFYSVCLKQKKKGTKKKGKKRKKNKSECVKKSRWPSLLPGDKVGKNKVLSCGCCAGENKSPDYCNYEPLQCDTNLFSDSCAKTKVQVEVCYTNKHNKIRRKCLDPFKKLGKKETFIGCGELCEQSTISKFNQLLNIIGTVTLDIKLLQDRTTPQYAALDWLANEDAWEVDIDLVPPQVLIERYVMALLFLSTDGTSWTKSYSFLTPTSVCDWSESSDDSIEVVICDGNDYVERLEIGTYGIKRGT